MKLYSAIIPKPKIDPKGSENDRIFMVVGNLVMILSEWF